MHLPTFFLQIANNPDDHEILLGHFPFWLVWQLSKGPASIPFNCVWEYLLKMIKKNPPPLKEDLLLGFSQKQMTRRPTPPAVAENLISVTPESLFLSLYHQLGDGNFLGILAKVFDFDFALKWWYDTISRKPGVDLKLLFCTLRRVTVRQRRRQTLVQ